MERAMREALLTIVAVFIVVMVLFGFVYMSDDSTNRAKIECIKATQDAAGCAALFK